MVSRNLTEVFILMRNNSMQSRQIYNEQAAEVTSDRVALINKRRPLIVEEDIELGGEGRDPSEYLSIPPAWIDDLEDIRYNSTLISQKVKELDILQSKHVQRPTFDDDTSTELQIEEVTQAITKLFSNCHRIVQQMQGKGQRSSWSERRLKDNVIKSVIQSLQELSTNFRSSQGTYLRKITAREEMSNQYFEIPNLLGDAGPYSYDQDFLISEGNVHRNQEWTQQQLLALEDDNVYLQEREREVQQVVKSIMDLNTIFRDLASMVAEQAGMVDRIDYHVENTHIKVEEGTKQLQKAANYQKRNRKCVSLVACVVLTVLLIILLVALGT